MLNDSNDAVTVVPEGFQFPPGRDSATVMASSVDESYFDTMGIAVLEGRHFRIDDSANAPRVAMINQPFAQHYWPNQDPIGKRFRLAGEDNSWVQIVGLAKTTKYLFSRAGIVSPQAAKTAAIMMLAQSTRSVHTRRADA
jgi:hypothetical protein